MIDPARRPIAQRLPAPATPILVNPPRISADGVRRISAAALAAFGPIDPAATLSGANR